MKKYIPKVSSDRMLRTMTRLNSIKKRFRKPKAESTAKSLMVIESVLEEARDFKLDAEVVLYALMYMRDNPGCQISEAIIAGSERWVN